MENSTSSGVLFRTVGDWDVCCDVHVAGGSTGHKTGGASRILFHFDSHPSYRCLDQIGTLHILETPYLPQQFRFVDGLIGAVHQAYFNKANSFAANCLTVSASSTSRVSQLR